MHTFRLVARAVAYSTLTGLLVTAFWAALIVTP